MESYLAQACTKYSMTDSHYPYKLAAFNAALFLESVLFTLFQKEMFNKFCSSCLLG